MVQSAFTAGGWAFFVAKKMVNKRPSLQFYPGDWLRDVELQSATATTIGVWINVLCRMFDSRVHGEISGNPEMLAPLCLVSQTEFSQFLLEAEMLQFCYMKRNSNGSDNYTNYYSCFNCRQCCCNSRPTARS